MTGKKQNFNDQGLDLPPEVKAGIAGLDLPPEVDAEVAGLIAVLLKEKSRVREISNAFYDKIATLSAASIALAVPLGITILGKQELRYLIHGLLAVILCFLFSLLTAIVHNFLLVRHARVNAVYAIYEFNKNTFKALFRHFPAIERTDMNEWEQIQIQRTLLDDPSKRQAITNKWMERYDLSATVVGLFSITCFFAGYTLVVIGAFKIWW